MTNFIIAAVFTTVRHKPTWVFSWRPSHGAAAVFLLYANSTCENSWRECGSKRSTHDERRAPGTDGTAWTVVMVNGCVRDRETYRRAVSQWAPETLGARGVAGPKDEHARVAYLNNILIYHRARGPLRRRRADDAIQLRSNDADNASINPRARRSCCTLDFFTCAGPFA